MPVKTTHAIEITTVLCFQATHAWDWHIAMLHNAKLRGAWEAYQRDPMNADARAALVDAFRARFPNELD